MEQSILRFPDNNGYFAEAGLRAIVPALILMTAKQAAGVLGFTRDVGDRQPIVCFTTPRIQEMYDRFKENGVNIVNEIYLNLLTIYRRWNVGME
ncbi:hypothetical protein O9H85_37245 [Paenibacillus filicis]|uniref:Uncharacterized protein n=1 Tax=Paenibacillus gyeongsangnamensis TaxID=3388067 RepID=A0ABT4QLS7_9BACL|nr:hypothetical protein [Paenibacillus filicis]MCZ8517834.1 hypothetical protein [Paenibacillus filicis]